MVCFLVMGQPGFANEASDIVGIWKLVSYQVEVQATGEMGPAMGQNPTGYVLFTPEKRVMFVLTGEGRKPAKTPEDRAQLLNTLVAYTGMYRIEGDKWITKVDVAWNPEWLRVLNRQGPSQSTATSSKWLPRGESCLIGLKRECNGAYLLSSDQNKMLP